MVGFGSSLRMSRRRGWEDAYLDYHSLRLLLTQIETVYEEEDWKQSSAIDNNNNTNTGGGIQSSEDENDTNSISIGASEEIDDMLLDDSSRSNNTGLKGLWYNAVRTVTGKRSSSYYYHRQQQKRRTRGRRYPRRITSFMNNNSDDIEQNNNNGWVSNQDTDEYFDYSDQQLNTRGKRKKDIKDSHDRALDKGGWREKGVTDYRDELFLVSDEEAAYGYDDDDESVWEDEEEEEDSIRGEDDEQEQYYKNDGSGGKQFDGNLGSSNEENIEGLDLKERSIIDEERSKKLTPGSEKSMAEDTISCNSPSGRDRQKDGGDSLFESTLSSGLLHTPNSQSSPTNQRGHKVQFSDSPGVLETGYEGNNSGTGYETFASAAQRRGLDYSQNVGDSSNMMIAGSPSERQGWLESPR